MSSSIPFKVASGGDRGAIKVWNGMDGTLLKSFGGHEQVKSPPPLTQILSPSSCYLVAKSLFSSKVAALTADNHVAILFIRWKDAAKRLRRRYSACFFCFLIQADRDCHTAGQVSDALPERFTNSRAMCAFSTVI